jgi:hypothetical protein
VYFINFRKKLISMNIDAFVHIDRLRKIVGALPGTSEGSSYGTPGFYVGKKLMIRLKEDGQTLVVRTGERENWMKMYPAVFFITDHYLNYPAMLINLKKAKEKDLQVLIENAWRMQATKKIINEYEHRKKS